MIDTSDWADIIYDWYFRLSWHNVWLISNIFYSINLPDWVSTLPVVSLCLSHTNVSVSVVWEIGVRLHVFPMAVVCDERFHLHTVALWPLQTDIRVIKGCMLAFESQGWVCVVGTHSSAGCDTVWTGKRPFSAEPGCCLFRAQEDLSVTWTVILRWRYKPGGRWFDSLWCHWNFSMT
jgi:hypothetical protein